MKLFVNVKTGAKAVKVEKMSESDFKVSVKAPPKEGRANEAVIAALSDYFDVPKSSISIVSGFKFKRKVIEVEK